MRYSIEPRYKKYVKSYGFLSFVKNYSIVKNFLTMLKSLQQMQQKLPQKEQFKKQQKQLEI